MPRMRPLTAEQWGMLGVVLALVGLGGWQVIAKVSGNNGGMPRPGKQAQPDDFEASLRIGRLVAVDGHSVVCQPHEHHNGYVYTGHRYPRAVGGEVTNSIHHGFSMMRVPAGTPDEQWIVSPPSEVAW
jgi:hypothetical protein